MANNEDVLGHLADAAFDPQQTVFVAGAVPDAQPGTGASAREGAVEFTSYAPKDVVLKCESPAPAVLMLNDRFDPNWHVKVDGKPEPLLNCNYIMRGVFLGPGAHRVEFSFQPPVGPLYVSLAAIGFGLVTLGIVIFTGWRRDARAAEVVPLPGPALPEPGTEAAAA
ncbi:MAG TPA: YfhO family protein [Candidatus Acidoferrum sp.]|nr:YfhO family protein [Candidatus Acidoferrum sp.]